jgi:hypothetical protein
MADSPRYPGGPVRGLKDGLRSASRAGRRATDQRIVGMLVAQPETTAPCPDWRFDVMTQGGSPVAIVPLAANCAGGGEPSPFLPRQLVFHRLRNNTEHGGYCLENLDLFAAVSTWPAAATGGRDLQNRTSIRTPARERGRQWIDSVQRVQVCGGIPGFRLADAGRRHRGQRIDGGRIQDPGDEVLRRVR